MMYGWPARIGSSEAGERPWSSLRVWVVKSKLRLTSGVPETVRSGGIQATEHPPAGNPKRNIAVSKRSSSASTSHRPAIPRARAASSG
jgi:hypothetical protein